MGSENGSGCLPQNESLNGGGTLYVKKHPELRVRVVHGNTLTAAVVINGIPKDATEVFLTGATSKLGRAIALYLCRRRIRVLVTLSLLLFGPLSRSLCVCVSVYVCISYGIMGLTCTVVGIFQMLTTSTERFQRIQKEAPPELQHCLVQVTKYQAAQNCKVGLGSLLTLAEFLLSLADETKL